jgi:amino acid transporter
MVVPQAMMWTVLYNGVLGFGMLVVLCFSIGDVDAAVSSATGYPYITVLYNATRSYTATNILTGLIIVLSFPLLISCLASTSRQVFAFARDNGLPYSNIIALVHPKLHVPLNAVISPFIGTVVLALVNIGSPVAYQATVSLTVSALFSSYFVSIGCVALKRWRREPLPSARWSLGRYGFATNILAVSYLSIIIVFSFFPTNVRFDPTTMNWSVLVYVAVIVFSTVYYLLVGRNHYRPPVDLIKKD